MSDEHEHDETPLPEDAVEDLAPTGDDGEVSGGAVDAFLKIDSPSSIKLDNLGSGGGSPIG
jgi:hypothetical protein